MPTSRARRALGLVLLLCVLRGRAGAAECSNISGGAEALAHVDSTARLEFIQGELRHAARRARMWTWGWTMALGTLSGGQLALLPAYKSKDKVDLYVGSGTAFVGMTSVLALPMKVMHDQRWLDTRVRTAPAGTDPCALLADAERLLMRDANDQDPRRQWLLHVGNVLLNTGAGLLLGLAFDRWRTAFINGVAGIAVGEALVLTRPSDPVGALQRYRVGNLTRKKSTAIAWGASLQLDRDQYAMRIAISF